MVVNLICYNVYYKIFQKKDPLHIYLALYLQFKYISVSLKLILKHIKLFTLYLLLKNI